METLQNDAYHLAQLIVLLIFTAVMLGFAGIVKLVSGPFNNLLSSMSGHKSMGIIVMDILVVLSLIAYFIAVVKIFL